MCKNGEYYFVLGCVFSNLVFKSSLRVPPGGPENLGAHIVSNFSLFVLGLISNALIFK